MQKALTWKNCNNASGGMMSEVRILTPTRVIVVPPIKAPFRIIGYPSDTVYFDGSHRSGRPLDLDTPVVDGDALRADET